MIVDEGNVVEVDRDRFIGTGGLEVVTAGVDSSPQIDQSEARFVMC